MPSPLEFRGHGASAGFASGPVWTAPNRSRLPVRSKGLPIEERGALAQAINHARAETIKLIDDALGDAADILEFQLALLEDETLSERAGRLIDAGNPADTAWQTILDNEIVSYETSNEYFRARGVDLHDVRDRVLAAFTGATPMTIPPGVIVLADEITPSQFLTHDWSGAGLALRKGSVYGHVAMLARQRGIPAVVGVQAPAFVENAPGLLDAEAGLLTIHPDAFRQQRFEDARASFVERSRATEEFARLPAMTLSGRRIVVMVNLADPAEAERIPVDTVDGVGLMRTEFLFGSGLPDEEAQFRAYQSVLDWASGRPVTIRTVDAGADKQVPGLTHSEDNAFLGVRGIRLSLARPEVFRVQVRALLRAAVAGNLKVMLPMVSSPHELDRTIALFESEAAGLSSANIAHAMPPIGIMVEVPAVALEPERFARAAFYSIGTNDLTQYVFAAARDNGLVSHLARADDPAVLGLVRRVAAFGASCGKEVSVCGDAASEPDVLPHLLDAGIATLSVAASRVGLVKARIAIFGERESVQG